MSPADSSVTLGRVDQSNGRGLAAFGDVARLILERVGGGIVNGAFKRHTGIEDVDVAGTLGMAGEILAPAVGEAYSAQPNEPVLDTLQRRAAWTLGLAGTLVLVAGVGYVAWTWLKKSPELEFDDEGEGA